MNEEQQQNEEHQQMKIQQQNEEHRQMKIQQQNEEHWQMKIQQQNEDQKWNEDTTKNLTGGSPKLSNIAGSLWIFKKMITEVLLVLSLYLILSFIW